MPARTINVKSEHRPPCAKDADHTKHLAGADMRSTNMQPPNPTACLSMCCHELYNRRYESSACSAQRMLMLMAAKGIAIEDIALKLLVILACCHDLMIANGKATS